MESDKHAEFSGPSCHILANLKFQLVQKEFSNSWPLDGGLRGGGG